MASLNKWLGIGRLGRDPEMRRTTGGTDVANFSIATDESYTDKSGQKVEKTEWHAVVAWGKKAELAQKYLHKGSLVLIEGPIQTRSWNDKDGQKKYKTEVVANNIQFLEPRGQTTSQPQPEFNMPDEAPGGRADAVPEDDLPF